MLVTRRPGLSAAAPAGRVAAVSVRAGGGRERRADAWWRERKCWPVHASWIGRPIAFSGTVTTEPICSTCDEVIPDGEGRYRTPYGDHHAECFEEHPGNVWLKAFARSVVTANGGTRPALCYDGGVMTRHFRPVR